MESMLVQGGRDATFSTGVRNFSAAKFAENGANTTITRHNSTVGGMYGTTGSTQFVDSISRFI